VAITHRLLSVAHLFDRLLVLADGRLVEDGPPAVLLEQPGSQLERLVDQAPARLQQHVRRMLALRRAYGLQAVRGLWRSANVAAPLAEPPLAVPEPPTVAPVAANPAAPPTPAASASASRSLGANLGACACSASGVSPPTRSPPRVRHVEGPASPPLRPGVGRRAELPWSALGGADRTERSTLIGGAPLLATRHSLGTEVFPGVNDGAAPSADPTAPLLATADADGLRLSGRADAPLLRASLAAYPACSQATQPLLRTRTRLAPRYRASFATRELPWTVLGPGLAPRDEQEQREAEESVALGVE
jgi:hypothetical protein